ncbi:hypothetical protein [Streptomyces sp. PU_AKi4]|uniref:hypothetical protein n=1 Tax=Streptomyces sp. PU_AKi4 TaxID=2800809 RepID=UPI0035258428
MGRESAAQQLLDAFPIPARALSTSGPAAAWRENSATAADAVEDLAAQRAATAAEDSTDYFAAPELLHAATSYLAAREGQLHLMHDALGRLAFPAPVPRDLPKALAPVAAAQTQRRVIEAFGTLERAAETLDGQLHYQLQQHRRTPTGTESDLLNRALDALEHTRAATVPFDEEDIRARLQEAMARPAAPAAAGPAAPTGHDEAHAQAGHRARRLRGGPVAWILSTVIRLLLRAARPLVRRGLPHPALAVMSTLVCGTALVRVSSANAEPAPNRGRFDGSAVRAWGASA